MHYVYVLKSLKQKWIYIGCTDDLKIRFTKHQKGGVRSTQFYRPFKLVYYEAYLSKTDARKREVELKQNSQQKEFHLKRIGNSISMAPSSSLA